jgi:hypothetical protein
MRTLVTIAVLLSACAVVLGAAATALAEAPSVSPPTISGSAVEGETLTGPVPSPDNSLDLFVKQRPVAYKRAIVRASGSATPSLSLWLFENRRGNICPTTPAGRTDGTRALIDGAQVGGDFSVALRPMMNNPGQHAYCAYLGANEQTVSATVFTVRRVRKPLLRASLANNTVKAALRRHGFADRVLSNLQRSCSRRSRSEFECSFSSRFPGYSLTGHGSVELKRRVSYRFPVSVRGRSFTLTDENEGGLPG